MLHVLPRVALLAITAFIAVTAIYGALFVVAGLPLEWLEDGPFTDYTLPAIALGLVGVASIVAFIAVIARPEIAGAAAMLAGALLVAFELVEVWVVGLALVDYGADEPVAWLQVVFITLGLIQIGIGAVLWGATRADHQRRRRTHGTAALHP